MRSSKVVCLLIFLTLFSHFVTEGKGTNPNPTGGFGQASTNSGTVKNTNSTGGFGNSGNIQTLGPPPPPPDPTPLDPGVGLLIAATLALGFKKLYNKVAFK
jgi:hypothetical protein